MAPSIGGVSCEFVKGWATGASESVVSWRRPGLDGSAAKKMADESGRFKFIGIEIDTNTNVETWQTSLEALRSTIVSIVDDNAVTHTNCLIETVSPMTKFPILESGVSKQRAQISVAGFITP